MKIELKFVDTELNALKKTLIKKRVAPIERLLKRFESSGELTMEVEVGQTSKHHKQGNPYFVQLMIMIPNKQLVVRSKDPDVMRALKDAKEAIKREIKKYKDKITTERRKLRQEKNQ